MLHLDTSVLVEALCGERKLGSRLREVVGSGARIQMSSPVFYEWLRGPRRKSELDDQDALFPRETVLALDAETAAIAARLYKQVPRARMREIDIAIAACAIRSEAALWTLNRSDFADIPELKLF